MENMLVMLERELNAIKDRDGVALTEVATDKEALLQAIVNVDNQINNPQFTELFKQDEKLSALKDEIVEMLNTCQQKNEVIYLAATQNQVAVDQVRRMLVGGSKNTTYDSYGQKQSGSIMNKGIKA